MAITSFSRSGNNSDHELIRRAPEQAAIPTGGRWAEMRIIRQVNYEAYESRQWNRFLNEVGSLNYDNGTARALGSMACTFIDAQSMTRMLAKRYEKSFDDRRKRLQIVRGFSRDFNHWSRKNESKQYQEAFEQATLPRLNRPIYSDDHSFNELDAAAIFLDEADLINAEVDKRISWNSGTFAVRAIEKYGSNNLGFDLSGNDQLYREWYDIRDYMRHEGLDVKVMRFSTDAHFAFQPHLSFFKTHAKNDIDLTRKSELPTHIPLNPPHAQASI